MNTQEGSASKGLEVAFVGWGLSMFASLLLLLLLLLLLVFFSSAYCSNPLLLVVGLKLVILGP